MRELDAVVDVVVRGVGPDDGPDLADAGFEHSARHDTRNRRSGRSSAGASPAAAGCDNALGRVQQGNPDVGGDGL